MVTLTRFICKISRVVSHLFTGSLAGISKLPALAGWYSVWYVRYFVYCKIWRELHFVKFCGNSPQKRGLVHQKGGRSEGKRGSRQMYDTEGPYRVFLRYRLGKYRENTNRHHTKIPNRDTTLKIRHIKNIKNLPPGAMYSSAYSPALPRCFELPGPLKKT